MFRYAKRFISSQGGPAILTCVSAVGLLVLSPLSAAPQAGYTVQTGAGGTISGKVLYAGKPVHPKKITVTQDQSTCGNMKEIPSVQVNDGGVADAVVWIDDITHGKDYSFPSPVMDQKGCMFMPHVVLMKPGQLKVTNSDNAAHNVHIFPKANRSFNQVQPPGGDPLEIPLFRPDTAIVRCDVHTWMQSYVVVAQNPYYVLSGKGGTFTLTEVPPGTYRLKVWQETLGTQEQSVTIQAGQTATANFTLK